MNIPEILNVRRHDYPDRTLIILAGEVDVATAPAVREALMGCVRDGVRAIEVDMTSVGFCDCLGLGVFLGASRKARQAGASLRLHSPSPRVARLISLTRTGSVLLGPSTLRDGKERLEPGPLYGRVPVPAPRSGRG